MVGDTEELRPGLVLQRSLCVEVAVPGCLVLCTSFRRADQETVCGRQCEGRKVVLLSDRAQTLLQTPGVPGIDPFREGRGPGEVRCSMVVRNAGGGFGLRPGESPIDLPKEGLC